MRKDFDIDAIDASPYPERVLIWISLLCSVASIFSSWLICTTPRLSPGLILLRDNFAFMTILIVSGYFFLRYRQVLNSKKKYQQAMNAQLEAIRELISQQIGMYHNLMRKTREAFYQEVGSEIYRHRFNYRKAGLNELLGRSLTAVISALLYILYNQLRARATVVEERLSVSVKAIVTGQMAKSMLPAQDFAIKDDEVYVVTLDRDHDTKVNFPDREVLISCYELYKNTDFAGIMYSDRDCFLDNDLAAAEARGEYDNANPDWKRHYNATLVVPISHRESQHVRPNVYGFLTVDSKNRGRHEQLFNRNETKSVLSFGAELLALIFLYLEICDRLPEQAAKAPTHGGQ